MAHTPTPVSSTQLALDLTPQPDAEISRRVIDFLRSEPSAHDVAREIVLQFLAPFGARASVISVVEPDATLRIVGIFGVPENAAQPGYCSIWDEYPSASAVRLREPVVTVSAEHCAQQFPGVRERGLPDYSVVAVPLLTSVSTVGAVSAYFSSQGSTLATASHAMQAIADVYVLFLASRCIDRPSTKASESVAQGDVSAHNSRPPSAGSISKADLTERQLMVLRLMSEGLTYDQIATRIGYSHSTVREELMHVYRLLGVHSRRQAAIEAIRRGILPSSGKGSTDASLKDDLVSSS